MGEGSVKYRFVEIGGGEIFNRVEERLGVIGRVDSDGYK